MLARPEAPSRKMSSLGSERSAFSPAVVFALPLVVDAAPPEAVEETAVKPSALAEEPKLSGSSAGRR
jgi:hypothetical protein